MTRTYTFDYNSRFSPSAPFVDIHVYTQINPENSQKVTLLVDSGADSTILPIQLLQEINAPMTRMATIRGIHGIRKSTRLYEVSIRIGDYTINCVEVASSREPDQVVLGRDVLNYLVVTLDGPAGATILV